jgi:hypothetical protein
MSFVLKTILIILFVTELILCEASTSSEVKNKNLTGTLSFQKVQIVEVNSGQ